MERGPLDRSNKRSIEGSFGAAGEEQPNEILESPEDEEYAFE